MTTVACVVKSKYNCALRPAASLLTPAQPSPGLAESWTAVWGQGTIRVCPFLQLIYLTPVATQALISGCARVLGDISLLLYV